MSENKAETAEAIRRCRDEALDVLTPEEAAVELRCHYRTVLMLIHSGKLRASKFGRQRYRIQRSAIAECLKITEVQGGEVVTEEVRHRGSVSQSLRVPERSEPTIAVGPKSPGIDKKWWEKFK